MSTDFSLIRRLREYRLGRGWSQQQLADAAGVPRANVSAIEAGRLVPSTVIALRLAAALQCRVEELFALAGEEPPATDWAWEPTSPAARFWLADVGGRRLRFPCESALQGTTAHDGVWRGELLFDRDTVTPPTLVMACCDPGIGLLATELARQSGVRLVAFFRSSRQALSLVQEGKVHVAGLHLSREGSDGNLAIVRETLGEGYRLLRLATWEDGVVTGNEQRAKSAKSLATSSLRWIGREAGSGARQCLDELLGEETRYRRMASDHRGVIEAVRGGWVDAGVAPRMMAEEAGLRFLPVRIEAFDLCFAESLQQDLRFKALLATLQSGRYRRLLGELPGYDSRSTGELL